jgi:uncharacterized protein YkwD
MPHLATWSAAASLLVLAGSGTPASADAQCGRADDSPSAVGREVSARTTQCLINRERAARGLRPLRVDPRLSSAARSHSDDMVAQRYFAHDSPSGVSFTTRIERTGWMRSRRSWTVGENIGEGSGALASPRALVSAWMHSSDHRASILAPEFRLIGIGVTLGTRTGEAGATYTTDFGG